MQIKHNSINILTLNIEVIFYKDDIAAASVLDIANPDFQAFELDLLEMCEIYDFELVEDHASSNKDSLSHYYTYIRTNKDGTKLKVYLKIRISDHAIDDDSSRDIASYKKRDEAYVKNKAKEYAETHFSQPRGYRARRIDVIFNDQNYASYEQALRAIEKKLDEFDID